MQLWVPETWCILILLLIYYCIIFHMNNCKTSFVPFYMYHLSFNTMSIKSLTQICSCLTWTSFCNWWNLWSALCCQSVNGRQSLMSIFNSMCCFFCFLPPSPESIHLFFSKLMEHTQFYMHYSIHWPFEK